MKRTTATAAALAMGFMVSCVPTQAATGTAAAIGTERGEYSPYLQRDHPDRVLWGDTHVHTSYSTDAGMIGNRLGPDEASRH